MALKTLLNDTDRALILERLRRVRPDTNPIWGTLTAPRVLCHLADQMRVALGDAPTKPTHSLLTRLLFKNLVVNTGMAAPRGEARAVHPAFGPLSSEEWGRLCYKHLDHHLTQFGA